MARTILVVEDEPTLRETLAEATTFDRFVAGAEANVAGGLTRLGCRAAYIGRVGDDGFGERLPEGRFVLDDEDRAGHDPESTDDC